MHEILENWSNCAENCQYYGTKKEMNWQQVSKGNTARVSVYVQFVLMVIIYRLKGIVL